MVSRQSDFFDPSLKTFLETETEARLNSSRRVGLIVMRSIPASSRICCMLRKDAAIILVLKSCFANSLKIDKTDFTPGSLAESKSVPNLRLCQSEILPTNGDTNVAPASAHATAYH